MADVRYKLLYVDDELRERPHLADAFEDAGFDVTAAMSGQQAYDSLIAQHSFDAIILDNMMPVGSDDETSWRPEDTLYGFRTGIVLLRKLKSLADKGTCKVPPIWILTALPDSSVHREATDEEMKGIVKEYVYKIPRPGAHMELARRIRAFLDQGEAQRKASNG